LEIVAVFGIRDDARRGADAAEQRQIDGVAADVVSISGYVIRTAERHRRVDRAMTSQHDLGDREPSVRALSAACRDVADPRVRRAVHRAERAAPRLMWPSSSFEAEAGKCVVVIEAIVVADDRRVDRAGHRHRAARARARRRL
jgi:hypothetical protein